MAKRNQFKLSKSERHRRTFSDSFKMQKVQEIEKGQSTVSEISKEYEVTRTNVYRWIRKFGTMQKKNERYIVETESDTKQLITLKKKIAELEQIIGQKQILIDFKDKMIDLAEETYGVDIKKKFSTRPSNSTGKIENDIPSV